MIIFRRQPRNFRLNCLSYHKKCSAFFGGSESPTGDSAPGPHWGLRPQTPAASPSQKSWIRHWSWSRAPGGGSDSEAPEAETFLAFSTSNGCKKVAPFAVLLVCSRSKPAKQQAIEKPIGEYN